MQISRLLVVGLIILSFAIVFLSPKRLLLSSVQKPQTTTGDLPILYPYPLPIKNYQASPNISAQSAQVLDAETGISLYQKDPNSRHLPASTAKLMTALIVLEKCTPDQVVTVGNIVNQPSIMGLAVGDQLQISSLLYGLLVASANDAAYALAHTCAESVQDFILQMNLKAKELGMQNTNFTSPAGFDNLNQYTTALDLAKLAKVAIANPLIAKIVATKSIQATDAAKTKTYYLENTNQLLGQVEGVVGIKTGLTEGSKEVLLTQTKRGGNNIITVVLASEDRFQDSKVLIEWAFKNHQWITP